MTGIESKPSWSRRLGAAAWRWTRRIAVAALVLGLCTFGLGEWYASRDPERAVLARRDTLQSATRTVVDVDADGTLEHVELVGELGLCVDAWLLTPPAPGPHAVVVVLGGQNTDRELFDHVELERPVALLAIEYPYDRGRKPHGLLEHVAEGGEIHRAVFDVVPATLLAIDWLSGCDDIDPKRIVLVGGSLGALFAPAVAAYDGRVAALALLFGAGDIGALVAANVHATWPVPAIAGWAAAAIAAPLEPLRHIGSVSPRPVLIVSAAHDERMPEELAIKLHTAAGEPCTVRWLDLGHATVRDPRYQGEVLGELLTWFDEIGVLGP